MNIQSARQKQKKNKMGKGREWSDSETLQLCKSWMAVSQNSSTGSGQKKASFSKEVFDHWTLHKTYMKQWI